LSDADVFIPHTMPWEAGVRHFITPAPVVYYLEQYREQMRILWQGYGLINAQNRQVISMAAPVYWDGFDYVHDYTNILMTVRPH